MYIEGDVPYVGTNTNSNGWNDWSWIIGLALVGGLFGGWGNGGFGFGNGRSGNCGTGFVTNDELQMGFFRNDVADKLDGITNGLCDGFYATAEKIGGINQTLCQGFSGINQNIVTNGYETRHAITDLGYAMKDCCCTTQRAIDGVNYNIATQFGNLNSTLCGLSRDIIDNANANYRAIHEELIANKIEAKNERIAELEMKVNSLNLKASQEAQNAYLLNELKPCPSAAYIVPNPNCCYNYTVAPASAYGCTSVQ